MSVETESIKPIIDAVAVTTTASALVGWLPPIVAILTLVWTVIRIYETETVQRFVQRIKK